MNVLDHTLGKRTATEKNWNLALYAVFTQMEAIPGDAGQVRIKGRNREDVFFPTAAPAFGFLARGLAASRPRSR